MIDWLIVITIHDSWAYYKLRRLVITIYDRLVITILDNCYYNLRQALQFTTLLQFTTKQLLNGTIRNDDF